jgi:hypothetical protein
MISAFAVGENSPSCSLFGKSFITSSAIDLSVLNSL